MTQRSDSPRVIFAHGKESGPWGSKIQHLAAIADELGYTVDSPDYQGMDDPRDRVARLLELRFLMGFTLLVFSTSSFNDFPF